MHYTIYDYFFRKLGDEWEVPDDVVKMIEAFTCCIYGYERDTSINHVRYKMLKKMVGEDEELTTTSSVDLNKLPPCRDNLIPHIQRCNHRLAHYKRAMNPRYEYPKPHDSNQGWHKPEGMLEPIWTIGEVLPQSLIDLVETVDIPANLEIGELDLDIDEDVDEENGDFF